MDKPRFLLRVGLRHVRAHRAYHGVCPRREAASYSLMRIKSYHRAINPWNLQRTSRVHLRTKGYMSEKSVLCSGVPAQKPFSQLLLKQSHPSSVKQAIKGD